MFWCALIFCSLPARACLWDNDTLETEVRGLPGAVAIITGRFPRNPDLYYSMRLARVTKVLQSSPDQLELYDDAGVACDRLKRGDEAIAWMEKKRAALQRLTSTASVDGAWLHTHRYRYHANLGTFYAHRWLRNGANRNDMRDMKRGRSLIARAIKLNPDAHFGREKYQLKAMDWILNPPVWKQPYSPPDILGLHTKLDLGGKPSDLKRFGYGDAIEGLTGLIALGDAWESVDIFYALKLALMVHQDTSLAYFAEFRRSELVKAGRRSLHPDADKPENQNVIVARDRLNNIDFWNRPRHHSPDELEARYKELRAEADGWQSQRAAYMMARLNQELHPDTNEDFWSDWHDTPAPSLAFQSKPERRKEILRALAVVFGVLALSLSIICWTQRRRRVRSPQQTEL